MKIYPEADRQKGTVKVEVQIHQPNLAIIKPELSVKANFLEKRPVATKGASSRHPGKECATRGQRVLRVDGANRHGQARFDFLGREMVSGLEVKQGLKDGDVVIVAPPASSPTVRRSAQLLQAQSAGKRGEPRRSPRKTVVELTRMTSERNAQ